MNNIYSEALNVWNKSETFATKFPVVNDLDLNKKFANFFQPGPTYYFVFNVSKGEFDFVSDEIVEILGYQPDEYKIYYFLNKIHPEDQPYFVAFEQNIQAFLQNLGADKLTKYKFQYTFRILDSNGKYKTILHQIITLEYNVEENTTKSLGFHSDITHLKIENTPTLSFIGLDGEPSFYNIATETFSLIPDKEVFTSREKEIIKLVAEGNRSKDIAQMLNLSVHTVHTHRKNILKKTGSSNWIEASSKAVQNGWI